MKKQDVIGYVTGVKIICRTNAVVILLKRKQKRKKKKKKKTKKKRRNGAESTEMTAPSNLSV